MQFPQSKQEESTEEEEIKQQKQQQRIVIMKDLIKKIRSKRRMDAKRRLWVSLQKYRVGWDATDGRSTKSLRNCDGTGKVQGAFNLGCGSGEGSRAFQPPCGLGLGDAFLLPTKDFACALWVF